MIVSPVQWELVPSSLNTFLIQFQFGRNAALFFTVFLYKNFPDEREESPGRASTWYSGRVYLWARLLDCLGLLDAVLRLSLLVGSLARLSYYVTDNNTMLYRGIANYLHNCVAFRG